MWRSERSARGSALMVVFVVSLLLLSMAISVATVTSNRVRGTMATERSEEALAAAEAALALQVDEMRKGNYPTGTVTTHGSLGDITYTIRATELGGGNYKVLVVAPQAQSIVDKGDGTYAIELVDQHQVAWDRQGRAIEAYVTGQTFHPFLNYAIFAGNKGNNASYHFDFGGYKTYTYTTKAPTKTTSTSTTSYGTVQKTTPLPTPNPQVTVNVTSTSTQTVSAMYVKQGPNSSGKYRWQITTTTDTVYNPTLNTTTDTRDAITGDVYVHGDSNFYSANEGTPQSGTVLVGGGTVTGANVDVTGSINKMNGTPVTTATNAGLVESNSGFVTGSANSGFSTVIPAPDLEGTGYTAMANAAKTQSDSELDGVVYVDGPNSTLGTNKTNSGIESGMNATVKTTSSSSNLASIFAKNVLPTSGMGSKISGNGGTTNANYFLGDWHYGSSGETITIDPSQNNKTYYVPGNLWIETNGYGPQIKTTDGSPVRITVVATGNIYFADQLLHSDYPASASKTVTSSSYDWNATPNKDAIALIAMASPANGAITSDSYTDNNNDGKWNPGEPILHADGSVTQTNASTPSSFYKGPKEGTGNVYYGDPNTGPLGLVNSYIYAQNNFDDYALNTISGEVKPQPFVLNGNMSAGNEIRINRDFLETDGTPFHAKMTVRYDPRLQSGAVSLPNLPNQVTGTTAGGVSILSWRELAVK